MTSGRSPAAAADVMSCANWSSATETTSTSTPASSTNASTMASVAATRSGRSSCTQKVRPSSELSSSDDVQPVKASAAIHIADIVAAEARLFNVRLLALDIPDWSPMGQNRGGYVKKLDALCLIVNHTADRW